MIIFKKQAKHIMFFMLTMGILTLGALPLNAAEKGYFDQKAIDILDRMADYLEKAKTFSFSGLAMHDETLKSGIKIKLTETFQAYLQRPDRLHVEKRTDDQNLYKVWIDGNSLVGVNVNENTYHQFELKGNLDQFLDHIMDNYELQLPLADLLYSDINGTFRENMISAEYLGEKLVDGVLCHHLSFESTGADWQLWVDAGKYPVPRRFAIVYVTMPGEPEFLALFRDWRIDPKLSEDLFKHTIPAGAKEVPLTKLKEKKQ